MPTAADNIADRFIQHDVNLLRLQAHHRAVILRELQLLEASLIKAIHDQSAQTFTKARQQALLKQVRTAIATSYGTIAAEHTAQLQEMAAHESQMAGKFVNQVINATVMSVGVPDAVIKSLTSDQTILGAPVRNIWKGEASKVNQAFISQMRQGILAGETTDQLVRRVRGTAVNRFQDGIPQKRKSTVEMLVRTSAQSVLNDARMKVFKDNDDVLNGYQLLVTLDERTSSICQARSGFAWGFDGKPLPNTPTNEDFPGPPPYHPNAVLAGSTFGSYGELDEMVMADYHGPAILVQTTQGQHVTIGPNHPILTRCGMVRARDLQKGDELVHDRRMDRTMAVQKSNLHEMPLVEDVFEALRSTFLRARRAPSRYDFHGDGIFCQGEVEVIEPQHGLLSILESCGIEQFRKHGFVRPDVQLIQVAGDGPRDVDLVTVDLSTTGGMGGRRSAHFQFLTVQSIHSVEWRGKAFDATTATGLYNSDGFVVSNCRSTLIPVLKSYGDILDDPNLDAKAEKELRKLPRDTQSSMDGAVAGKMDYPAWFATKGSDFQKEVLGPGKYLLYKEGKLSLRDLIDVRGRPLSLAELKKRFG